MTTLHQTLGAHSLVDVLQAHAESRPDKLAFGFLDEGVELGASFSFAELDDQARALGATLQQLTRPGDRALLLYPPGLDFVVAFMGCQYAGVTAIPALPPNLSRAQATLGRLGRIVEDATPALALTTSELLPRLRAATREAPSFAAIRWQASDRIDPRRAALWQPPSLEPGTELAFLQYTSGSTSAPKGVMVSHQNLLANLDMVSALICPEPEILGDWDMVSWLPQFHDMGLIGVVLLGIYNGASTRLMSPMSFLKRPIRWLQAIAAHPRVVSGGPNFAFDLCLRRIADAELEGLDLSGWASAFCGSEQVRTGTMARFAERFAACGLRPEALLPCYGLAEATLAVSGRRHGRRYRAQTLDKLALSEGEVRPTTTPEASLSVTSCGVLAPGCEVAIVDPEHATRLAPGRIGEIWVRGEHVARGYWNKPEQSEATFEAELAGEPGRSFLRTGDLGFIDGAGELYVTGRRKEVILVRGRCIYPQDLELAIDELAARQPELAVNESFAFALPGDEREGVGLITKINRRRNPNFDAEQLVEAIQREIGERFDIAFTDIALVRASPPKTSSGKKMRIACRDRMAAGELAGLKLEHRYSRERGRGGRDSGAAVERAHALALDPRQRELNGLVLDWIAEETRLERSTLSSSQPLTDFALDSLAAVNLLAHLEEALSTALSSELLEQARTVDELSAALVSRGHAPAAARSVAS